MRKFLRQYIAITIDVRQQTREKIADLLVDDGYPTLEGLKHTLEIQALTDPRAAKTKAEDLVELRFVDEVRKSGFVEKLR
jgi:hypothetical protein